MPFIVTLRPSETIEIQAEAADSLDELFTALAAQVPEGFELDDIRASQNRGTARRSGSREVTIESRDELATCAPHGWQAVSILAA